MGPGWEQGDQNWYFIIFEDITVINNFVDVEMVKVFQLWIFLQGKSHQTLVDVRDKKNSRMTTRVMASAVERLQVLISE